MENRRRILAFQGLNGFCKVDWAPLRDLNAADNVNRLAIKEKNYTFS